MATTKMYYPGLDVLRGVAITLVVFYHYFPFFRIGWIGVDLFFVLSGFLITSILLNDRAQKGYFKNFYRRRILRIFPLYYLVLIVFYISAPLIFSQKDAGSTYRYYVDNQTYFWTFTQNWLFILKGMPTEPYLSHFWSLAIEEQFYLFWPFLVYSIKKLDILRIILVAFFLLALSLRIYFHHQGVSQIDVYYCNLFTRLDTLSAGSFLAVWLSEGKKVPRYFHFVSISLFAVFVIYSALLSGLNNNSILSKTIGFSIYALFFTSCCFFMLAHKFLITKIAALAFLGRISYGIYVYHLPILLLIHYFLAETATDVLQNKALVLVVLSICAMGVTLLTSAISYNVIESPFLRFKKRFT